MNKRIWIYTGDHPVLAIRMRLQIKIIDIKIKIKNTKRRDYKNVFRIDRVDG